MNTMSFLVWMLPIIFMVHDFEEIVMAEVWGKRYKKEIDTAWPKRQPFGLNDTQHCQTPAFSIGVAVEFVLFTLISFFSVVFQNYFVWYGAFLGLALHLIFIHVVMCIWFRHYVPGVITSIVFILPSIWFLYRSASLLHAKAATILLAFLLGIALILIVIPFLHKRMRNWSEKLYRYSMKSDE